MNNREDLRSKEKWLRGVVDGMRVYGQTAVADQLDSIANELGKAANNMCSAGFYGCKSNDNCTSSHK